MTKKTTKLNQSFYKRNALEVAPDLIGRTIVRRLGQDFIRCKIVEVEAYVGPDDKAAHVYNNKRTSRTEAMFLSGGHTYVYLIYGIHHCLNIVTGSLNKPQGVLLRAVEPLDDHSFAFIKKNRQILSKKLMDLTNGPGKLCQALKIDKAFNQYNLIKGQDLFLEEGIDNQEDTIVCGPRINIPYAEEYIHVPWRFFIQGNPYVSVADLNATPI